MSKMFFFLVTQKSIMGFGYGLFASNFFFDVKSNKHSLCIVLVLALLYFQLAIVSLLFISLIVDYGHNINRLDRNLMVQYPFVADRWG